MLSTYVPVRHLSTKLRKRVKPHCKTQVTMNSQNEVNPAARQVLR